MSQTLTSLKKALRICAQQLNLTRNLLTNRLRDKAHAQREYNEARRFHGYADAYAIKTSRITMLQYWEEQINSQNLMIADLRHQCDKLTKDKEVIQVAIDKLEIQQP